MLNKDLLNASDCIIVPCKLSVRDFVKNSKNNNKFEKWEYESIIKDTTYDYFSWNFNEENDLDELCDRSELIPIKNDIKTEENSSPKKKSTWQLKQWEEDIITTSQLCLFQLNQEFSHLSNVDFPSLEIRFSRSSLRKSVLDYFPIHVEQTCQFMDLDRRFFPIIFNEEKSLNQSLLNLAPIFHRVSNGESKYISQIDRDWNVTPSADTNRLFLFESSEQHSPFRMQSMLTSLLVAYSKDPHAQCPSPIGLPRQIKRKSPFFGSLSDNNLCQLALENPFFRVPVYRHEIKSTDFLLYINKGRLRIRKFEGLLLGGKQMPLRNIYHPRSGEFRKLMMKVVNQLFIDNQIVPVDVLANVLSNVDFLNLQSDLQKIAVLSSDRKYWKLKDPVSQLDGFFEDLQVEDYMIWSAIVSYLSYYEYVQSDKKLKKSHKDSAKKKTHKNSCSPWSISKSYLNGIHKGFWKLGNFEEPTRKNQMDSFLFVKTLVSKRIITTKTDLRKLTVYETHRLLKKFQFVTNSPKRKKMKRWTLVNQLSTQAATNLGDNNETAKYARDSKTNKRLLRKKYVQQCQDMFEKNRLILSNPVEPESENDCVNEILKPETKDISVEDFKKFIKEELNNNKKSTSPLPDISNPDNIKKLIENPLKQFIIYRKKDGVVTIEKYPVNEYVLNYLKHAKSGRFGRKLYGIGDIAKREKQQERDKKRRQEKYKKRRMEMNLPLDINCQDTTDKICSSCGRRGHIRTNQECPNYDKPPLDRSLSKQEKIEQNSNLKSTLIKPKLLKKESSNSVQELDSCPIRSQNAISQKRFMEPVNEKETGKAKKLKLLLPHSENNDNDTKESDYTKPLDDNDDEAFIIRISSELLAPKSEKPKKTNRKKKSSQRKSEFSACAGPNGNETIIFQPIETILSPPPGVNNEDFHNNSVSNENWNAYDNRAIEQEAYSDCDSDEYTVSFSADMWNKVNHKIGEKENINQEMESGDWKENDEVEENDDDEFTINFFVK